MSTLQDVLLLIHLLGMAALVGGYLSTVTAARTGTAMIWGARFQLLTGLALAGLAQSHHWPLNNVWLGVKLVVAFVVVALLEVTSIREKKNEPSPQLVHAAGILAIVNVAVATLWH